MDKEKISNVLRYIVDTLLSGRYEKLVEDDNQKLLTPDEIKMAIEEYKGVLTIPPEEAFDSFDTCEVNENEAAIDFDLWMDHSKSDLTLSLNIVNDNGVYRYSIENIHVL